MTVAPVNGYGGMDLWRCNETGFIAHKTLILPRAGAFVKRFVSIIAMESDSIVHPLP